MSITQLMLLIGDLSAARDVYLTQHSLRFDGTADYLGWSNPSASNRTTNTFSFWFKPMENAGAFASFFQQRQATLGTQDLQFFIHMPVVSGRNSLQILGQESGTNDIFLDSGTDLNFEAGTWYHLVVAVDTTQGVSSDRVKVWIDGQLYTNWATGTYPSQNYITGLNRASTRMLISARRPNSSATLDRYSNIQLAEYHFIDGTAYDASYFGETRDGVWLPKEVTGVTYGNNGFYLDFADSSTAADLGNDVSGNGNDFSVNGNITADDQLIDTPNLRFATWDPSNRGSTNAYREGNLLVDIGSTPDEAVSTMGVSSGKIYAEYYWKQGAYFFPKIAIGTSDSPSDYSGFWSNDGNKYDVPTGSTSYGSSFSVGSIISVAVDANTGTVWWAVNGSWQGGATVSEIEAGTTTNAAKTGLSGTIYVRADDGSSADQSTEVVINFGQDHTFAGAKSPLLTPYSDANGVGEFYYQPPSGFLALAIDRG